MKKKLLLGLLVLIFATTALFSAFDATYSDSLFYHKADYKTEEAYLLKSLDEATSNSEKAQILWRLSRNILSQGDQLDKDDKDNRYIYFEKSEAYADESLALEATPDGYHWKSSAIGRWGQTKGPLNSLGKAKPMLELILKVQDDFKADNSDTWYVMGVLYNSLPGGPISFGNNNWAISYMRRCLDTQDTVNRLNLTNFEELSNQLYSRNWNAKKRATEFDKMKKNYDKGGLPSDQMKYYEGANGKAGKPFYSSVTLDAISDRQEAVMLLKYAVAIYESRKNHLPGDTEKYNEIKARLAEIS